MFSRCSLRSFSLRIPHYFWFIFASFPPIFRKRLSEPRQIDRSYWRLISAVMISEKQTHIHIYSGRYDDSDGGSEVMDRDVCAPVVECFILFFHQLTTTTTPPLLTTTTTTVAQLATVSPVLFLFFVCRTYLTPKLEKCSVHLILSMWELLYGVVFTIPCFEGAAGMLVAAKLQFVIEVIMIWFSVFVFWSCSIYLTFLHVHHNSNGIDFILCLVISFPFSLSFTL